MGFMTRSLDRNNIKDKRLEDKTEFDIYLSKVEWVDMGNSHILYAKHDFPLDYLKTDEKLSLNDIKEIIDKLPDDVKIITKGQIKWLKDNCSVVRNKENEDDILHSSICCISDKTGGETHFNLCMTNGAQESRYFLGFLKNASNLSIKIDKTDVGPIKFPSYLGTPKSHYVFNDEKNLEEKLYNIKVVKIK